MLPKIAKRRLAQFADIVWDGNPEHRDAFSRYLRAANESGFVCKVHAGGLAAGEAIRMAVEHFAVSVDHLEHATPADATLLAGSGAIATLMPTASFRSGGGCAPAQALITAGVPVALASDFSPTHTPTLNMQTVISLGCLQMGMTAAQAVTAATINGAHALGCANRLGTLEPGKLADVLVLSVSDYRELALHFGMNLVQMTFKRGNCIYEEAEVAVRSPSRSRSWQIGSETVYTERGGACFSLPSNHPKGKQGKLKHAPPHRVRS